MIDVERRSLCAQVASLEVRVSDLGSSLGQRGDEVEELRQRLRREGEERERVQAQRCVSACAVGMHEQAGDAGNRKAAKRALLPCACCRLEAYEERSAALRKVRAAAAVQRAWRRWRAARLRHRADSDAQALAELEQARGEASHAAHLQAAHLGAGMVLDSMTVIRVSAKVSTQLKWRTMRMTMRHVSNGAASHGSHRDHLWRRRRSSCCSPPSWAARGSCRCDRVRAACTPRAASCAVRGWS